jgi:hypothetical protein
MNIKMLTISSLILITSFVYCSEKKISVIDFLPDKKIVDMSLITIIKTQAEKHYHQISYCDCKIALGKLYQTEKGKIYKQELERYADCLDDPLYEFTFILDGVLLHSGLMRAAKDLRSTEEYTKEFLPIEKKCMYNEWITKALKKMDIFLQRRVVYLNHYTQNIAGLADIKCMLPGLHSTLHAALYVDISPRQDLESTRDLVYNELTHLINELAVSTTVEK